MSKEDDIEEILSTTTPFPMQEVRKKRTTIDPIGKSLYGDGFEGYMKVDEYRDLIPQLKELYYEKRIVDPKYSSMAIIREFNERLSGLLVPRKFYPYSVQYAGWRKKWDRDMLEKKGYAIEEITTKKHVQQVLKTRSQGDDGLVLYSAPSMDDLEQTTQTLAGELANDALQMLRDDQELEDIYESDELVKRKKHVVDVFSAVTKMVHGKAALMLKASEEKRENAGFLMELLNKASAGKMGLEEIAVLREQYTPKPPVVNPFAQPAKPINAEEHVYVA